ncbi:unnamed protein product [Amoebophrya sp. A25]|nr:unnamed protein product [Amoebophrya sp. A25]|eukprot:GSA25T00012027001.1
MDGGHSSGTGPTGRSMKKSEMASFGGSSNMNNQSFLRNALNDEDEDDGFASIRGSLDKMKQASPKGAQQSTALKSEMRSHHVAQVLNDPTLAVVAVDGGSRVEEALRLKEWGGSDADRDKFDGTKERKRGVVSSALKKRVEARNAAIAERQQKLRHQQSGGGARGEGEAASPAEVERGSDIGQNVRGALQASSGGVKAPSKNTDRARGPAALASDTSQARKNCVTLRGPAVRGGQAAINASMAQQRNRSLNSAANYSREGAGTSTSSGGAPVVDRVTMTSIRTEAPAAASTAATQQQSEEALAAQLLRELDEDLGVDSLFGFNTTFSDDERQPSGAPKGALGPRPMPPRSLGRTSTTGTLGGTTPGGLGAAAALGTSTGALGGAGALGGSTGVSDAMRKFGAVKKIIRLGSFAKHRDDQERSGAANEGEAAMPEESSGADLVESGTLRRSVRDIVLGQDLDSLLDAELIAAAEQDAATEKSVASRASRKCKIQFSDPEISEFNVDKAGAGAENAVLASSNVGAQGTAPTSDLLQNSQRGAQLSVGATGVRVPRGQRSEGEATPMRGSLTGSIGNARMLTEEEEEAAQEQTPFAPRSSVNVRRPGAEEAGTMETLARLQQQEGVLREALRRRDAEEVIRDQLVRDEQRHCILAAPGQERVAPATSADMHPANMLPSPNIQAAALLVAPVSLTAGALSTTSSVPASPTSGRSRSPSPGPSGPKRVTDYAEHLEGVQALLGRNFLEEAPGNLGILAPPPPAAAAVKPTPARNLAPRGQSTHNAKNVTSKSSSSSSSSGSSEDEDRSQSESDSASSSALSTEDGQIKQAAGGSGADERPPSSQPSEQSTRKDSTTSPRGAAAAGARGLPASPVRGKGQSPGHHHHHHGERKSGQPEPQPSGDVSLHDLVHDAVDKYKGSVKIRRKSRLDTGLSNTTDAPRNMEDDVILSLIKRRSQTSSVRSSLSSQASSLSASQRKSMLASSSVHASGGMARPSAQMGVAGDANSIAAGRYLRSGIDSTGMYYLLDLLKQQNCSSRARRVSVGDNSDDEGGTEEQKEAKLLRGVNPESAPKPEFDDDLPTPQYLIGTPKLDSPDWTSNAQMLDVCLPHLIKIGRSLMGRTVHPQSSAKLTKTELAQNILSMPNFLSDMLCYQIRQMAPNLSVTRPFDDKDSHRVVERLHHYFQHSRATPEERLKNMLAREPDSKVARETNPINFLKKGMGHLARQNGDYFWAAPDTVTYPQQSPLTENPGPIFTPHRMIFWEVYPHMAVDMAREAITSTRHRVFASVLKEIQKRFGSMDDLDALTVAFYEYCSDWLRTTRMEHRFTRLSRSSGFSGMLRQSAWNTPDEFVEFVGEMPGLSDMMHGGGGDSDAIVSGGQVRESTGTIGDDFGMPSRIFDSDGMNDIRANEPRASILFYTSEGEDEEQSDDEEESILDLIIPDFAHLFSLFDDEDEVAASAEEELLEDDAVSATVSTELEGRDCDDRNRECAEKIDESRRFAFYPPDTGAKPKTRPSRPVAVRPDRPVPVRPSLRPPRGEAALLKNMIARKGDPRSPGEAAARQNQPAVASSDISDADHGTGGAVSEVALSEQNGFGPSSKTANSAPSPRSNPPKKDASEEAKMKRKRIRRFKLVEDQAMKSNPYHVESFWTASDPITLVYEQHGFKRPVGSEAVLASTLAEVQGATSIAEQSRNGGKLNKGSAEIGGGDRANAMKDASTADVDEGVRVPEEDYIPILENPYFEGPVPPESLQEMRKISARLKRKVELQEKSSEAFKKLLDSQWLRLAARPLIMPSMMEDWLQADIISQRLGTCTGRPGILGGETTTARSPTSDAARSKSPVAAQAGAVMKKSPGVFPPLADLRALPPRELRQMRQALQTHSPPLVSEVLKAGVMHPDALALLHPGDAVELQYMMQHSKPLGGTAKHVKDEEEEEEDSEDSDSESAQSSRRVPEKPQEGPDYLKQMRHRVRAMLRTADESAPGVWDKKALRKIERMHSALGEPGESSSEPEENDMGPSTSPSESEEEKPQPAKRETKRPTVSKAPSPKVGASKAAPVRPLDGFRVNARQSKAGAKAGARPSAAKAKARASLKKEEAAAVKEDERAAEASEAAAEVKEQAPGDIDAADAGEAADTAEAASKHEEGDASPSEEPGDPVAQGADGEQAEDGQKGGNFNSEVSEVQHSDTPRMRGGEGEGAAAMMSGMEVDIDGTSERKSRVSQKPTGLPAEAPAKRRSVPHMAKAPPTATSRLAERTKGGARLADEMRVTAETVKRMEARAEPKAHISRKSATRIAEKAALAAQANKYRGALRDESNFGQLMDEMVERDRREAEAAAKKKREEEEQKLRLETEWEQRMQVAQSGGESAHEPAPKEELRVDESEAPTGTSTLADEAAAATTGEGAADVSEEPVARPSSRSVALVTPDDTADGEGNSDDDHPLPSPKGPRKSLEEIRAEARQSVRQRVSASRVGVPSLKLDPQEAVDAAAEGNREDAVEEEAQDPLAADEDTAPKQDVALNDAAAEDSDPAEAEATGARDEDIGAAIGGDAGEQQETADAPRSPTADSLDLEDAEFERKMAEAMNLTGAKTQSDEIIEEKAEEETLDDAADTLTEAAPTSANADEQDEKLDADAEEEDTQQGQASAPDAVEDEPPSNGKEGMAEPEVEATATTISVQKVEDPPSSETVSGKTLTTQARTSSRVSSVKVMGRPRRSGMPKKVSVVQMTRPRSRSQSRSPAASPRALQVSASPRGSASGEESAASASPAVHGKAKSHAAFGTSAVPKGAHVNRVVVAKSRPKPADEPGKGE